MLTRSRSISIEVDGDSQSQASSLGDSAPLEEIASQKRERRSVKNKKPPIHVAQWVCILPDDPNDQFKCSFVSLKDPKTACERRFLLRQGKEGNENTRSELYEVMKVNDGPRSWFIDNSVQTDGSLHMCTPIDPLFLALPYLLSAAQTGKFTTLDNIFEDPSSAVCCNVLEDCIEAEQWQHVTDTKQLHNKMSVFKYSWPKTRAWLGTKVEALSCALEREGVYAGAGSKSTTLVRSSVQSNVNKAEYLHYACGIVSDYLPKSLADELAVDYPNPLVSSAANNKHHIDTDVETPPTKKSRYVSNEPLEDYTKLSVKTQSKQVARAKSAAKGTKSVSSFFSSNSKLKTN